jgi:hypothetical protein
MPSKAEHLTTIRAANPTLTRVKDGVRETLSGADYASTTNAWADAAVADEARVALEADGGETADYKSLRTNPQVAGSYPSIGDQLDMQYHDAVNGTTTWRDAIAATKAKFQKPD